jgi:hypothetical protein
MNTHLTPFDRAICKALDLFPAVVWIGSNQFFVQSTSSNDTYHVVLAENGGLEGADCTCPAGEKHETCVHRARAFLVSPARTWAPEITSEPVCPELALVEKTSEAEGEASCEACQWPGLEYEHTEECFEKWVGGLDVSAENPAGTSIPVRTPALVKVVDGREVACGPICRNANRLEELCWNCYADFEVDMLHALALEVGLNAVEKALAAPRKAA